MKRLIFLLLPALCIHAASASQPEIGRTPSYQEAQTPAGRQEDNDKRSDNSVHLEKLLTAAAWSSESIKEALEGEKEGAAFLAVDNMSTEDKEWVSRHWPYYRPQI